MEIKARWYYRHFQNHQTIFLPLLEIVPVKHYIALNISGTIKTGYLV